jgi:hypothetical protein
VLSNSLGTTALINFSAGDKDVFVTYPSEKAIYEDASNNVGIGVIPSNNDNFSPTLQIKNTVLNSGVSGDRSLLAYNYDRSSGTNTYISNGFASYYSQLNSIHSWHIAPSGIAGASATVTSGQIYTVTTLGNSTLAEWQARFSALTVLPTLGQVITATSTGSIAGTPSSGTVTQQITFTQAMTLDAIGNVGIGVTPSAWSNNSVAVQLGSRSALWDNSGALFLSNNLYKNEGGQNAYLTTSAASYYNQSVGVHSWATAPSGIAGTTATLTTTMRLDANGNLSLGTVTPSTIYSKTVTIVSPASTNSAGITYTDTENEKTYAVGVKLAAFEWYDVNDSARRMRITASGGVVIGSGGVYPTANNLSVTGAIVSTRITPRVSTTTSSATPTINTNNTDQFGLTAQAVDITSFTTNLSGTPTDGQKLWIYIVGTAARAITWGASFEASTVALPTTTVTTARLDVGFVWNADTSKWRCVAVA